ncbi:DUF4175 domain-containing protein [Vibrio sp. S9_S30]|uniref:hypothetical protein n=1 Tax=Vibrio sp. S9_S30 TaxID=2720226 RepID=UPI00168072C0|nr:hypothetical protein [Vibrio sp. S9_S30]MBD1556354.1 DUF4175 domain-containing protein [Vibrio sp. S9_S30]
MQISTLSRTSLTFSILILAIPAHSIELTEKQIELSINTQMAWMKDKGAFSELAACSGKPEATITKGIRSLLEKCLKGDENQFELCYRNELKSVLGVTDARLEACIGQYGNDEEDQYYALKEKEEKLLDKIDELSSSGDDSDVHRDKIEALEQQLQDLYREMEPLEQAAAEQTNREWEIATNEVRKMNKKLAPLEEHPEHNMPLELDEPWRGMPPNFDHLPDEQQMAKEAQWSTCANMIVDVTLSAESIGAVKRQPEAYGITDEQNQQALREQYHASYGTFLDTIDRKILEISLNDWEFAHTAKGMYDISKKAWDWCQAQPPEQFIDIDDSRL